nr:hypothetical protein [Mycobacterium marinum]
MAKLEADGVLQSFERRIDPAALGYSLTAFIMVTVTQRKLGEIGNALEGVPDRAPALLISRLVSWGIEG